MKHLYTSLLLTFTLSLVSNHLHSQILSENFNTGNMPLSWTQSPTATWSISSTLGVSGSTCILSEDMSMTQPTTSVYSPTLNLLGITNLTITFKAAVVKNNFVSPNITLVYNNGSGNQFLARWGSGFTSPTTYSINDNADFQQPLDAANVSWEACTHTVSVINGSSVRFGFDAEFVNGGYVLIDDVVIKGKITNTTGIGEADEYIGLTVFPNPVTNKTLTVPHENAKSLKLYDQLGKIQDVHFFGNPEGKLTTDLSSLPAGIYYLQVLCEGKAAFLEKIILP